jgi:hypothetical protein
VTLPKTGLSPVGTSGPLGVKIGDVQSSTKEVLSFMASHGSQGFTTTELLMMERICDKLISIGIAHLTSTKQCDIRSFLLSSVRPINEALK